MLRRMVVVASLGVAFISCTDSLGLGSVSFCMQWVNTTAVDVTFSATDDLGHQLNQHTVPAPDLGDAFTSPLLNLTGEAPITFSANSGFGSITFKPAGGSTLLLVEATTGAPQLTYYQESGGCS